MCAPRSAPPGRARPGPGAPAVPACEPVTKFNATVDDVARFPDMVRWAFRAAVSGTPGPVHLQFRGNEGQVDAEEAEMEPLVDATFRQVPPFRPEPGLDQVRAALALLQQAERPVIVAGGGGRAPRARGGPGAPGGGGAPPAGTPPQCQGPRPRPPP